MFSQSFDYIPHHSYTPQAPTYTIPQFSTITQAPTYVTPGQVSQMPQAPTYVTTGQVSQIPRAPTYVTTGQVSQIPRAPTYITTGQVSQIPRAPTYVATGQVSQLPRAPTYVTTGQVSQIPQASTYVSTGQVSQISQAQSFGLQPELNQPFLLPTFMRTPITPFEREQTYLAWYGIPKTVQPKLPNKVASSFPPRIDRRKLKSYAKLEEQLLDPFRSMVTPFSLPKGRSTMTVYDANNQPVGKAPFSLDNEIAAKKGFQFNENEWNKKNVKRQQKKQPQGLYDFL